MAQTNTRLAGHGLWWEGKIRDAAGYLVNCAGSTTCECGAVSPVLSGTPERKRWHRAHKDDIRNGGTGEVWGVDRDGAPVESEDKS